MTTTQDPMEEATVVPSGEVPIDQQVVRPTFDGEADGAIAVVGPWWKHLHPAGRLVRAIALQLSRVVPTRLHSCAGAPFEDSDISLAILGQVGHLRNVSSRSTLAALRYVSLERTDQVHGQLIPAATRWSMAAQRAALRNTFAIVEPEACEVSKEAADVLSMAAGVITTDDWRYEALEAAGVPEASIHVLDVPVLYEPEPVLVKTSLSRDTMVLETRHVGRIGAPFGPITVPEGRRYYSIGNWHPGSGLAGILSDFVEVFSPPDASLEMAVRETERWPGYPTVAEAMEKAAAAPGWSKKSLAKRVRIVDRSQMTPAQVLAMHERNNIYVEGTPNPPALSDMRDALFGGNVFVLTMSNDRLIPAVNHCGPWPATEHYPQRLLDVGPPKHRVCKRRRVIDATGDDSLLRFIANRMELTMDDVLRIGGVLP